MTSCLAVPIWTPIRLSAPECLPPGEHCAMDIPFFTARLEVALALREAVFEKPFYRLAYGDSDTLPGLVIDRFDKFLVLQLKQCGPGALS